MPDSSPTLLCFFATNRDWPKILRDADRADQRRLSPLIVLNTVSLSTVVSKGSDSLQSRSSGVSCISHDFDRAEVVLHFFKGLGVFLGAAPVLIGIDAA